MADKKIKMVVNKAMKKASKKTVRKTAKKAPNKATKNAEMIYTWGSKRVYEKRAARAIAGIEPFMKGIGGSMWRTYKEARAQLEDDDYRRVNGKVFGVLARWGIDTKPNTEFPEYGFPYHDLLIAAPIIELDDRGSPCEKSKTNASYFPLMRKSNGAPARKAR